ncbi:MAG: HEPN domain-containing protein [Candidatus Electrothrix sp. MAN1_4]|nr:HEPN domain-containing protein [Candidatus Electrothrix sp. MAN1_4]
MTPEDRQTIIIYRLERAEESLRAARLLRENNMLIPAMNRIYYAMFYAVQAVLARDEAGFSKHGQVKGYFNREYIKTRIFPVESGKLYNMVFEYRQKFDYVDLVMPDVTAIDGYLRDATVFVQEIRAYLFPVSSQGTDHGKENGCK